MKTLQQIDTEIAQLEQKLAVLHEQRREWVNYHDINKKLIRMQDFKVALDQPMSFARQAAAGATVLHVPTGYSHRYDAHELQLVNKAECVDALIERLTAEGWTYAS